MKRKVGGIEYQVHSNKDKKDIKRRIHGPEGPVRKKAIPTGKTHTDRKKAGKLGYNKHKKDDIIYS